MTNTSWIEPPPKKGIGCFAKGCLILAVFALLLGIAGLAGLYWGMHTESAVARGILWLTKIHAVADRPAAMPAFNASDEEIEATRERWRKFEEAVHEGRSAEIELTGDDLNRLMASNPEFSGKVFASIEDNWLRFQVSIPLTKFVGRAGHYFNADIVMESVGPKTVEQLQLNRIKVNNEPLPRDLLNWKLHSRPFRDYLSEYANVYRTGSIEIRDGKLILRSGSD